MKAYKIYDGNESYSFIKIMDVIFDEIEIELPKGAKEIMLNGDFPAVEMPNGEITDILVNANGNLALKLRDKLYTVKYKTI